MARKKFGNWWRYWAAKWWANWECSPGVIVKSMNYSNYSCWIMISHHGLWWIMMDYDHPHFFGGTRPNREWYYIFLWVIQQKNWRMNHPQRESHGNDMHDYQPKGVWLMVCPQTQKKQLWRTSFKHCKGHLGLCQWSTAAIGKLGQSPNRQRRGFFEMPSWGACPLAMSTKLVYGSFDHQHRR